MSTIEDNVEDTTQRKKARDVHDEDNKPMNIGEFSRFVNATKTIREALESPIEKVINETVTNKIIERALPSLFSEGKDSGGSSFLNSGFAMALGQKIGESIPAIIDILSTKYGGKSKLNSNSPKSRNMDDIILSLDPENPAHIHEYMAMRSFDDIDIARMTLKNEKEKVMKRVGAGSDESDGIERIMSEQNKVLQSIALAMQDTNKKVSDLSSEIDNLKKSRTLPDVGMNIDAPERTKTLELPSYVKTEEAKKATKKHESIEEILSEKEKVDEDDEKILDIDTFTEPEFEEI